jgi:CTP synthase
VGDYEGLSFIEAIREFAQRVGRQHCLFIHVVYVPFLSTSKEFKTKPAQNALKDLRGFGIMPDGVVVRTDQPAPQSVAQKISLFSGLSEDSVLLLPNVDTVYRVPLVIARSGLNTLLGKFIGASMKPDLSQWQTTVDQQMSPTKKRLSIGLVAKYMDNEDTYLSVVEAIKAASWHVQTTVDIVWINAETATKHDFEKVDGILVPGGFGKRGIEGKIAAARYALDNNIPYLGICLGLQVAVIAAARKAGLKKAHSSECSTTTQNVVYIMKEQAGKESTGGTLRLGNYLAVLKEGSLLARTYGSTRAVERHRHRYEVNQKFIPQIEKGGVVVTGRSPDGMLVECIEAPANTYFVATQGHPEFKSRPHRPHALFVGLLQQVLSRKDTA